MYGLRACKCLFGHAESFAQQTLSLMSQGLQLRFLGGGNIGCFHHQYALLLLQHS